MYVHNDFLQAFLDGGWICGISFIVFSFILIYKNKGQNRACIAVILAHCLFDFDLQYPSMWFVLILLCSFFQNPKLLEIKRPLAAVIPLAVLGVFFGYFTLPFVMEYSGEYEKAVAMYPKFTEAKCSLLLETNDADGVRKIADDILASNSHVSTAYDAKALAAYAQGDIEQFCTYKEKVLEIERYDITQYEDYVMLLYEAAMEAYETGDEELMDFCLDKAENVPQKLLNELKENTSPLAYKINDKPVFEMFSE
jgi:tetratricopeptide (TPR) repeat protein